MVNVASKKLRRVPSNGRAAAPLSAEVYGHYLKDALENGPETRDFPIVSHWPQDWEIYAGYLTIIRDDGSGTRKRARSGPVAWKSPRGWKKCVSVHCIPCMVRVLGSLWPL